MAARYEVKARVTSATDLKNVNWRHGNLKPYAVVWVEPQTKCSTYAAVSRGIAASYHWNQELLIPFSSPIAESTLHIDIMQAEAAEDTTPLIGSAQIPLRNELGRSVNRTLQLKRPSGRPQGTVGVAFTVRAAGSEQRAAAGVPTGSGAGAVAWNFRRMTLTDDELYEALRFDYDDIFDDDYGDLDYYCEPPSYLDLEEEW